MYAEAQIYLLDDVTSAVDRPTCAEIATRLLGPTGLLKALGATVIMTTHTGKSHRLYSIEVANVS